MGSVVVMPEFGIGMKSIGLFSDFRPPVRNGKIVTMKAGKGVFVR